MPSCVVKKCKNNSMDFCKQKGVTFHKFPKDMNWKYKWIKVIRECRSQETWLPSQFSVVCSVHFEDGDIYTTQGGNRRITKNAVPKLKLYDSTPRKRKADQYTVENVSVSVQTCYAGQDDDVRRPDGKLKTDVVSETSGYSDEQIQNVIIKVEPNDVTDNDDRGILTDDNGTQTTDQENVVIKVEPKDPTSIEISIDPLAPQTHTGNDTYCSADSAYYENELKIKNAQLNESRKKVRILNQKLNKAQKRNIKLKNILKEIKFKKLIDRDVFKQLTASLIQDE